jgi:hypothetical protein
MQPAPAKKPAPKTLLTQREDGGYRPAFAIQHLRAIHREIFRMANQPERFYVERREVLRMLEAFFGDDLSHLT